MLVVESDKGGDDGDIVGGDTNGDGEDKDKDSGGESNNAGGSSAENFGDGGVKGPL